MPLISPFWWSRSIQLVEIIFDRALLFSFKNEDAHSENISSYCEAHGWKLQLLSKFFVTSTTFKVFCPNRHHFFRQKQITHSSKTYLVGTYLLTKEWISKEVTFKKVHSVSWPFPVIIIWWVCCCTHQKVEYGFLQKWFQKSL